MTAIIKFKQVIAPNGKETDWVLLAPKGESLGTTQTWHRISKLVPPEVADDSESYQAMKARWELISPKYEAWKEGHELPEDGTPLAAWPGVSQDQAEILRAHKVRSVEDVSEMTDTQIQQIPIPNVRKLKGLAKDFLEARPAAEMQAQLDGANERVAAMEAMLEELTAQKKPAPKKTEKAA